MTACLDPVYRGNAIYEHVAENRGRSYVEEQIRHARIQLQKDADDEITTINRTHALVLAACCATHGDFSPGNPSRAAAAGNFLVIDARAIS